MRPNIIIFVADSLGYGDVGYNGHPSISTPNINKLAFNGMIFTQCYSGSPYSSSSLSSLLTGRLGIRYGLMGNWNGGSFNDMSIGGLSHLNEITFASILKNINYNTIMIGNWNLGQRFKYLPFNGNYGFDEYYGIPSMNNNNSNIPYSLLSNNIIIQQPVNLLNISHKYILKSVQFINKNIKNNNSFLLYISLNQPSCLNCFDSKYCNSNLNGIYGDSIYQMDHIIGKIMDVIQINQNIANNTLTFFTSSNGASILQNKYYHTSGGSNALFKDGKSTTWEGGIRVPFIANWPSKINKYSRSMDVISIYDIFNTVINIVNESESLPDDRIYDSMDISSILFNKQLTDSFSNRCLYFYGGTPNSSFCPFLNDKYFNSLCNGLYSMRCGEYKIHFLSKNSLYNTFDIYDEPLLFNINWDPEELHPIYTYNTIYNQVVDQMLNKKYKFEQGIHLKNIKNQILKGSSIKYALCCNKSRNCFCDSDNDHLLDNKQFECKNSIDIPEFMVEEQQDNVIVNVIPLMIVIGCSIFIWFCIRCLKRIYSRKSYQYIPDTPRRTMKSFIQVNKIQKNL